MATPVNIHGVNGSARKLMAQMHQREGQSTGIVAYTDSLVRRVSQFAPFTAEDGSSGLNVDASAGGTPELVHDGIDTVAWTGSQIVGTDVTFNSTARPRTGSNSVYVDGPDLNDIWQFDRGSDFDPSNYVSVSLWINVDRRWSGTGNETVTLFAYDTNSAQVVGQAVRLQDYFDQSDNDTWQQLIIPFTDLGISTVSFDAFRMEYTAAVGTSPEFFIDDFQIEEQGTPILYRTRTTNGLRYYMTHLRVTMVDALAGTLADGTMPALAYDQLLGVAGLSAGINLVQVNQGTVIFQRPLRNLFDFVSTAFNITTAFSDGTNTCVVLEAEFYEPLEILAANNSYIGFTISENLSGLLELTIVGRGLIEVKE